MSVFCGLLAALPLWFCADFDVPTELNGCAFEQNMEQGHVEEGRFGKGYAFVSAKKRCENDFFRIGDLERIGTFPSNDGAFVCWFKCADATNAVNAAFSMCGFWQYQWEWNGGTFTTAEHNRSKVKFADKLQPSGEWRHFAATWNVEALKVYLDGELIASREKPMLTELKEMNRPVLRIGVGGCGRPACGLVMDEIAIISRSLTEGEVKEIATSDRPLRDPEKTEIPEYDAFKGIPDPHDPTAFIMHSWGGSASATPEFLKEMGLNCVNVSADSLSEVRRFVRAGMFVNLRLHNPSDWRRTPAEIRQRVMTSFKPYRNLKYWRTTLVNSEVYGAWRAPHAVSNAAWKAMATKALGHDPEVKINLAPPSLSYKALGVKCFEGVLPDDCKSFNTLNWFMAGGDPIFSLNRFDSKIIRSIRPDNLLWSEPSPPMDGMGMSADWIYDYGTHLCLFHILRTGEHALAEGVDYMPTLSGSYHHSWEPVGLHPSAKGKDGKPARIALAQSCDETMIKSWMAIGAVKTDAMSYFNAPMWQVGAENARRFAECETNVIKTIAEPDFANRYGRFVREDFLPLVEQLRGKRNVRAKLALLDLPEMMQTAAMGWTPHHAYVRYGGFLARSPVAYDVLPAREICPEVLSQYKYVVMPIGKVLTRKHYEALSAVSNTTKVIVDSYCKVELPNAIRLDTRMSYAWTAWADKTDEGMEPLAAWIDEHKDELHRDAVAWTEQDGKDAYTFVKDLGDDGYGVLVVNNRREERSLWPQLCTDPRYRAIAASNRVTVHFNLPGGEQVKTIDLKPAGARYFKVSKSGVVE